MQTVKPREETVFEPEKEVGTIPAIQRIVMNVVFLHGSADAWMLDNVKIGLSWLKEKCEAAIITHANVPFYPTPARAVMGDTITAQKQKNKQASVIKNFQIFLFIINAVGAR